MIDCVKVGAIAICNRKEGFLDVPLAGYRRNEAYDYIEDERNGIGGVLAILIVKFKH